MIRYLGILFLVVIFGVIGYLLELKLDVNKGIMYMYGFTVGVFITWLMFLFCK